MVGCLCCGRVHFQRKHLVLFPVLIQLPDLGSVRFRSCLSGDLPPGICRLCSNCLIFKIEAQDFPLLRAGCCVNRQNTGGKECQHHAENQHGTQASFPCLFHVVSPLTLCLYILTAACRYRPECRRPHTGRDRSQNHLRHWQGTRRGRSDRPSFPSVRPGFWK